MFCVKRGDEIISKKNKVVDKVVVIYDTVMYTYEDMEVKKGDKLMVTNMVFECSLSVKSDNFQRSLYDAKRGKFIIIPDDAVISVVLTFDKKWLELIEVADIISNEDPCIISNLQYKHKRGVVDLRMCVLARIAVTLKHGTLDGHSIILSYLVHCLKEGYEFYDSKEGCFDNDRILSFDDWNKGSVRLTKRMMEVYILREMRALGFWFNGFNVLSDVNVTETD